MASDTPGDTSVSVTLPEPLSRWLDDEADDEGRTREDVLLQLLSAHRRVDGLEDGPVDRPAGIGAAGLGRIPADPREELEAGIDERVREQIDERVEERIDDRVQKRVDERVHERVDERLDDRVDERVQERLGEVDLPAEGPTDAVGSDELDERLNALQSRFADLLEDVRERVIQVKREADGKAPVDHGHPETEAAVAELRGIAAELETLEADVATVESRLDAGFENYEEVLEFLADRIDRVSSRQTTLARAVVETRDELRKLAARDSARSAAETLKRTANRHGVRTADCGECGSSVDVALLGRAQCPHCSATFVDVAPARGFFGSHALETGERPALEAGDPGDDGFEYGVDEIVEPDDAERPAVDADRESGGGGGSEAPGDGGDGPSPEGDG